MSDSSVRSFPVANVILAIIFLGVAGLGIWVAMAQRRLSDELAAMIKTQSDLVRSQRETSTLIEQQTAVLHQALGNVLPVKMPPDWESRLTDIEAQVVDTNLWPKDAADAQRFLDQTSALVKGLPARAEADYLPRLNSIRWAAMAFVSLHTSKDFAPPNEQIADQLNTLISTKPEGGSSKLEQSLKQVAERCSAEAENKKLAEAIQQAQHYLDAKVDAAQASPEANPDILTVFEFLGLHEKDDTYGAEVQALRKKLHEGMVTRQAEQQAASLQTRWNVLQELKNAQPAVYETSANMLFSEVMTARVALAIEGVKQPAFDTLEHDLRHAVAEIASQGARREEQRQAKAIREYQRWALQQTKTFEEAWGKILESVAKRKQIDWKTVVDQSWWGTPYSPDVWVWNAGKEAVQKKILTGWEDQDYKRVRDAIVNHLLAINLTMLDIPVQERYQRAFQLGWKQLDGRDDQTYVAEQTAVTVKKPLWDFLENRP